LGEIKRAPDSLAVAGGGVGITKEDRRDGGGKKGGRERRRRKGSCSFQKSTHMGGDH